jgi:uncharacterized protein
MAGGSGSLGRRMADAMATAGADVVILTRKRRDDLRHRQVLWDGRSVDSWKNELSDSARRSSSRRRHGSGCR